MTASNLIYGTCVAVAGAGVLLRGPSGAGKSDLALRLMDGGAQLVADDQCVITIEEGQLQLSAPDTLKGMMEVRGVGIVQVPAVASAPLTLVIDLVGEGEEPRLPPKGAPLPVIDIAGKPVPHLKLWVFAASAPAKIRLAVHALRHNQIISDKAISAD